MSELIDRQAAIDAVNELRKSPWYNNPQNIYRSEAVDIVERLCIKELPSAQPECKTSEWLHEYLQTAVDFGIITETQASRLMDMIAEDNT